MNPAADGEKQGPRSPGNPFQVPQLMPDPGEDPATRAPGFLHTTTSPGHSCVSQGAPQIDSRVLGRLPAHLALKSRPIHANQEISREAPPPPTSGRPRPRGRGFACASAPRPAPLARAPTARALLSRLHCARAPRPRWSAAQGHGPDAARVGQGRGGRADLAPRPPRPSPPAPLGETRARVRRGAA